MIVTLITMVLVVTLMVGVNALYVAGEFATVGARKTRITQLAEEGNLLAKLILPVLEDSHKLDNYIAASQVGITLSSLVLGIYGQNQIAPRIEPLIALLPLDSLPSSGGEVAAAGISATLVLFLLTTLQVVFGELLPKSVALQYPERMALATAIPMKWSADYLLRPLIVILNGSGALVLKLLGVQHGGEHTHVHSPEEIVILVKESYRGGLLDADDRELLRNVFRVGETRAVEIAMPRARMVAASVDKPVEEVLRLAADSAFTRIPIYEKDIDHIIGFAHLKDLFNLYYSDKDADLRSIVRPVPYIPETLTSLDVWRRLNEQQSYLAIVLDEYGGTSGMITLEDVIEELFGELQDEFDQERALITPLGDSRLVVRGDMAISYLNDLLDIDLPHETSHSIGGLVLDRLGRIPQVGDMVEVQGIELQVTAVANNTVNEVSLTFPPGKELPSPEDAA
jgi:putative hemolysin